MNNISIEEKGWTLVHHGESHDSLLRVKANQLWKAPTYSTSRIDCSFCWTDHKMKVQRRECSKPACHPNGRDTLTSELCPVKWKLYLCENSGRWRVLQNNRAHIATAEDLAAVPEVALMTPAIREFIIKYEEADVKPKKIWSCLRREAAILMPLGIAPTPQQVSNVVKYHRNSSGSRNAMAPVEEYVRINCFRDGQGSDNQLVFSSSLDANGYPFVGEGSREEPLHLGVTTPRLLRNCLRFGSFDTFGLFHMDATFKLCRLGYPTITCGFSDQNRRYHVAAVFIVSRRTAGDYKAVLNSLNDIVYRVFERRLRVNAVMADAEDAQINASEATEPFSSATNLMCFFHVLYNVRKRIQHLVRKLQHKVYNGIVDMHYSLSLVEFTAVRDRVLASWDEEPLLHSFSTYFQRQWLNSKYWRWQIFHTPQGYAATNNPCEVFNAMIKRDLERKSMGVLDLLKRLGAIVEDSSARLNEVLGDQVVPSDDVKKMAKLLFAARLIEVETMAHQHFVCVRHVRSMRGEVSDVQEFSHAMQVLEGEGGFEVGENVESGQESDVRALTRTERARAKKLYDTVIKWSMRQAHEKGMPERGWRVSTRDSLCECRYFVKFSTCAHILSALMKKSMPIPGDKSVKKQFVSAVIRRQAQHKKRASGEIEAESRKKGRPPLMTNAMHVQYICD